MALEKDIKNLLINACEVCFREKVSGVVASCLGSFSFATGDVCLERHAEPLWVIESLLSEMPNPLADIGNFYLDSVTTYPPEAGNLRYAARVCDSP